MTEEELEKTMMLVLLVCHSKAEKVKAVVGAFRKLTDELDNAFRGPLAAGETYGPYEIKKARATVDEMDSEVGGWLRLQGIVALVSSLEVFLEDLLKVGVLSDNDLLKSFMEELSKVSRWKQWRLRLDDMSELVDLADNEDVQEWLLDKALEGVLFHRFGLVDKLYESAFGFKPLNLLDENQKGRLFEYRELRHEILHGIKDLPKLAAVHETGYLDRAVGDVLFFSRMIFNDVAGALGLEIAG